MSDAFTLHLLALQFWAFRHGIVDVDEESLSEAAAGWEPFFFGNEKLGALRPALGQWKKTLKSPPFGSGNCPAFAAGSLICSNPKINQTSVEKIQRSTRQSMQFYKSAMKPCQHLKKSTGFYHWPMASFPQKVIGESSGPSAHPEACRWVEPATLASSIQGTGTRSQRFLENVNDRNGEKHKKVDMN